MLPSIEYISIQFVIAPWYQYESAPYASAARHTIVRMPLITASPRAMPEVQATVLAVRFSKLEKRPLRKRSGLNKCAPSRRPADINRRMRHAFVPPLPPQLWAAPEAEVPLPPVPHIVLSGEQSARLEIQAHHDECTDRSY